MKVQKINIRPEVITEKEVDFLYTNWSNYILLGLRRRGFSPEDSEDILQMTFMYFWEFRKWYNNTFSIYTYLYRQLSKAIAVHSEYMNKHDKCIETHKQDLTPDSELYYMEDDENERDLLLLVIERMPEDLQTFCMAMLESGSMEATEEIMRAKGHTESYHVWYQRMTKHIQRYEPEFYEEIKKLFYASKVKLNPTQKAIKLLHSLKRGDTMTIERTRGTSRVIGAVMREIESLKESGLFFNTDTRRDSITFIRT